MSESDRALEIVHQAVQALSERKSRIRASAAALAQLAGTAGAVPRAAVSTSAVPTAAVPKARVETPTAATPQAGNRNLSALFAEATAAAAGTSVRSAAPSSEPKPAAKAVESAAPALKATSLAPATGTKTERLAAMRAKVLPCTLCPNLVSSRTQVVFGVGNPEAELMFVGEAPGADEDAAGEPFVGKAGQLLTKIIETMGLSRSEVYIANVLKCRPDMPPGESGNRKPTLKEMNTCKPYLLEQISIIQPKVLVALGATAMEGLLGLDKFPITKNRGVWQEFAGTPLMPTFHPAYLLRNQALSEKRRVWEDMLAVLERLGKPISDKQRGYFLSR
jgi:DNA polymerase